MEQILQMIASQLGVDPATLPLLIGLIVLISNMISKLIPESTTGVLGVVRKIASILGVALSNRITPNLSSKDISKALAAEIPDQTVKAAAAQLPEAVSTGLASATLAEAIVDAGAPVAMGRSTFEDRLVPGGE